MQSLQILHIFVLRKGKPTTFALKCGLLHVPRAIHLYTKFANFERLYFFILQHVATKLGSFTNLKLVYIL